MKNIFILAIALMVVGLAVVPQVQAQEDQSAEILRLTDDFMAGRITPQEFERRTQEILSGMSIPQQQPQQQQRQQPQNQEPQWTNGWPPANVLNEFGITGIPQSLVRGTPSYMRNPSDEFISNEVKPARSALIIRFEWANIDDVTDWFRRNGWTLDKNYPASRVFKKGSFTAYYTIYDSGAELHIGIR